MLDATDGAYLVLVHESPEQGHARTRDEADELLAAFGWRCMDLAVMRSQRLIHGLRPHGKNPNKSVWYSARL